jgi:hypothetical protein
MTKELLIKQTLKTLKKLPESRVKEVSDFAEFILKKNDEEVIQKGIEKMVSESDSFYFLNDEEDLYDEDDLVKN